MKHLLISIGSALLSLAFAGAAYAQGIPCPPVNNSLIDAGLDTTICPSQCANLAGMGFTTLKATTAYAASTALYAPYSYNTGTQLSITTDDVWSGVIPLPFPFCFFGNRYTQCIIGTNGQLGFNTALANQYNSFTVTAPAPTNYASYNNSIMAPFYDIWPTTGGSMWYATYGTAPCRRFVVSWYQIPVYGGGCASFLVTQQVVLYESTHVIEINIANKPACAQSTSGGLATLGIQNATGTVAYSFPGRNAAFWTETNASYRFTPNDNPVTTYEWRNVTTGAIVSTSATATVCPPDTTNYVLKVKHNIGCDSLIMRDTVRVNINNPITTGFTYDINYDCETDTVTFTNTSTGIGATYDWNFGDSTPSDTTTSPVHAYPIQAIYDVRLIGSTGGCKDTVIQTIDLLHPLDASFTVSKDSACQQETIVFNNTSLTTTRLGINPTWYWVYGDGGTDTIASPSHTYTRTGVYNAMLVVKDFVPCFDTAYHTIVIDSIPHAFFTVSDDTVCDGQNIIFTGDILDIGLTGYQWDFGDGTIVPGQNPISHSYDSSGNIPVKLSAYYRICPDTHYTANIEVLPFPSINLGPDTVLCPNGSPIMIQDHNAALNMGAQYSWSTGEATNSYILAGAVGNYYATVSRDGCSSTDSIEVLKDCYLDIPNAFSPNGDGDNDYFLPRQLLSRSLTRFTMSIFNRWGQKIFETTSLNGRGWDGKFNDQSQPTGVYIYMIEADLANDTHEKYTGNVTLLR